MKLALALALVAGASALDISAELAEWSLREHFAAFEAKFEKAYETVEQREEKFLVFALNLEEVVAKNAELRAAGKDEVHGVTQFSDMTKEEFASKMLTFRPAAMNLTDTPVATPTKVGGKSFDWRESGMVSKVKNQKQCGSCWAHSAVETLESQFLIKGGDLDAVGGALSVQQVVSCDTEDNGCGGGWYYTAWMDYIAKAGGVTTEANYPYDTATSMGRATACDKTKEAQVVEGTTPKSDSVATPTCNTLFCADQDEETLKNNLVSYGPVSIACDASSWNSYRGGVVSSSSCSSNYLKLDHAIQLVGYNEDAPTPYWIVRNSWDTTWGEDGYIYLEMGSNTCGLANMAYMVNL